MILQELLAMRESTNDVYKLVVGEDDGEVATVGDSAKICKKLISLFKRDVKAQGYEPFTKKMNELMPKWKEEADPKKLLDSMIKSDLAWDGYAMALYKNDKEI